MTNTEPTTAPATAPPIAPPERFEFDQSPAIRLSTLRGPGSTPVIVGNLLHGFVTRVPMSPVHRGGEQAEHWTFLTPGHYMSPFRWRTRHEAVLALLSTAGVDRAETVRWHDLDLITMLHAVTAKWQPSEVARTAIGYATAMHADRVNDPTTWSAEPGRQPGLLSRTTLRNVVAGLIGPDTADEVLAAYDAIADPLPGSVRTAAAGMYGPDAGDVEADTDDHTHSYGGEPTNS